MMPSPRERAIAERVSAEFGQPVQVSQRQPLEHQSNALYDAWVGQQQYIVKEYLIEAEHHEAPVREYRALVLLAPHDVAPQPVLAAPRTEAHGPLVVYAYMAGSMWDRRKPSAAELAQLANVWLTINTVPAAGLWLSRGQERALADVFDQIERDYRAYVAWAAQAHPPGAALAQQALRCLPAARSAIETVAATTRRLVFCRADPRFANVTARPAGRLGLVDWEDCGLRDPAIDVADLQVHPNNEDLLTPDEWQAFLQPYLAAHAAADPGLAHRADVYRDLMVHLYLSILLARGAQRARAGRLSGWRVNTMPANERLRRHLARAVAGQGADFQPALAALGDAAFFPEA